jgi:AcrR family transcriptional regulator
MSDDVTTAPTAPRRRDAAATRQALLTAAHELFEVHGFRGTTLRAIGERAGVDQALIARYFGGKAELHQAVLADEGAQPDVPGHEAPAPKRRSPREVIDVLLARVDEHGIGPIIRALLDPDVDPGTRAELTVRLHERITTPLARWLRDEGVADAKLRAEAIVAMMIGVMTVRANGGLGRVASADRKKLAALLDSMLGAH